MTPEDPTPLELALDMLVYVPVGLAMTAAEELPKLAAKGRARVDTQIRVARVVGELAVTKGRQSLEGRLPPMTWVRVPGTGSGPATAPARDGGPTAAGADTPTRPATAASETDGASSQDGRRFSVIEPSVWPVDPGDPAGDHEEGPGAADLAIPGYDSLSASQVVQRLAGLSGTELDQVRTYEEAHRGRRTILNRIDQLQGL